MGLVPEIILADICPSLLDQALTLSLRLTALNLTLNFKPNRNPKA